MFKKSILSFTILTILTLLFIPSLSSAQGDFRLSLDQAQNNKNLSLGSGDTSAQDTSGCTGRPKDFGQLFGYALCLLSGSVVPFLVALALVVLLVGIVQYVRAGDNEEKREAGRNLMIFGIITLFVMVSVWGFVKILHNTFFGGSFEIGSIPPVSKTPFK